MRWQEILPRERWYWQLSSALTLCLSGPHGPDLHQLHQELSGAQGGTLGTVPGKLLCQDDWDLWWVQITIMRLVTDTFLFRGDRGDPGDQNLCPGGYEQSVRALQVPGEITSHFTTFKVGDKEIYWYFQNDTMKGCILTCNHDGCNDATGVHQHLLKGDDHG